MEQQTSERLEKIAARGAAGRAEQMPFGMRGTRMEIAREEFDDRSEPDENGMYDFIYTGAYYTFRDGEGQELMFCLYSDTPETACLKQPIEWRPDVYASELFESAVGYLGREEGIKTIEVCDPTPPGRGFIPLEEAIMLADAAGLPVPPAKS